MLKTMKLAPVFLVIASAGLVGCEGNNSTTTFAGSPVITPIDVDKNIAAVEWDGNNDEAMASHAYRAIAQNSMLKLVFTNQLASFDILVNLFRVGSNRDCHTSGTMVSTIENDKCYLADETTLVDCNADDAAVKTGAQLSRAQQCQDGIYTGQYFDGFFNVNSRTDTLTANELQTSTTISAVGEINKFDSSGDIILDNFDDPITETITDYIFQNESFTFFFSNEYQLYVDFDTNGPDNLVDLAACTDENTKYAARQGMRSDAVSAMEFSGTNGYDYVEFTDLDLMSVPSYSCTDDSIITAYDYSFTATLASAILGGGVDGKTLVSWPDLNIPLTGDTEGTMTLTHSNAGNTPYIVSVAFDGNGNVTITSDNTNSTQTVSEFYALSNPVTEE